MEIRAFECKTAENKLYEGGWITNNNRTASINDDIKKELYNNVFLNKAILFCIRQ